MKIGIMVLSIGPFGAKGFYNLQETGLAKALDAFGNEVRVYKLVPKTAEGKSLEIEQTHNASISYLPSKKIGSNGIPDLRLLDKDMDVLVCFSDTQILLPKVYRWAMNNHIRFVPYIGVAESHSTNKMKQIIINLLFQRNVAVYRKCTCCAKTPSVQEKLAALGVKNTVLAPVGLDMDLLKKDYEQYPAAELKKKYGYQEDDKVILFIGRLTEEKQPVRMIEILSGLRQKNQAFKLLMVGTGELKAAVEERARALALESEVKMIDRIPNRDIWELYRFAEAFVNLNQQEVFGMAILEAMYYGCKVVAWNAPGPGLIIENGFSGWLAESNEEVVEKILDTTAVEQAAHQRVINHFTWETSARKILSIIGEE